MVKPIRGSWFEFQHHNRAEGIYWNESCKNFNCEDWEAKIREMSEIGIEYLVLLASALYEEAYYNSSFYPRANLNCADPMEAIFVAADKYGMKFFVSGGFFGDWTADRVAFNDLNIERMRLQALNEIAEQYGHHPSFYGWYWPREAYIHSYFQEEFIRYVNTCSREARRLTPDSRILIAPYGTREAVPDDKFVGQLDKLDVDIVAYQDEIGVQKTEVHEIPKIYEGLRRAHDKASKAAIWADVEVFQFESTVYKSALLPASFSRVKKQLETVSPYVDVITIYQYQGMMNKPGSNAFAGHPNSTKLYLDYVNWLE
ncbi:DUF4434 domain-containing protein [Xylanivirga thermophila]|uniref:DUF4434 domain-containing protein n=1 Tax=Xylanivirga thermophila TaxID=2496273 RepID=UPI00101B7539|nr:DUF4434 domain-containing protein [Xylanivirga thermophila]